jgi:hypothetical protein
MSGAGSVSDARAIDISVRWAMTGSGTRWVELFVSVVGCRRLKRRLRRLAERAFASLVIWDCVEARRLEPRQWPGGSGFAAIRADDLRDGTVVGGMG